MDDNADIESEAVQVERFERRRYIDDCDSGVQLRRTGYRRLKACLRPTARARYREEKE